ncbi:MAG: hypothetical protein SF187_10110 [Deltaproteobacteria bacterium]|nr:hypothetical protein [Deltaproteobacteria bacterium]
METLVFLVVMSFVIVLERTSDPSAGVLRGKQEARNLECQRISAAEAHARHPVQVPEPPARATGAQVDALDCQRLYMREGERPARDEMVLSSLRRDVAELVAAARAKVPHEPPLVWHVDAFYPDQAVAAKVAVAARTHMAELGLTVSDRVPLLAAGDIAVLGRLPAQQSYPTACARYVDQGVLGDDHVFMGLMIVDGREGQLHAGLCRRGQWTWLR